MVTQYFILGDRFDEVIDFMNVHKSKNDLLRVILMLLST
jgi:hypothetical protein